MDFLPGFLGSEARARLLAHFVVQPERRAHVRGLLRRTGIGKRSLQAELRRLQEMGLILRESEGRRVLYSRRAGPQWRAIESLVASYGPSLVLRDALSGVAGVEAAFVFGSEARGDARPDSDIDLLIYGNQISHEQLGGALLDAALVLDRQVDAKRYDRASFVRDIQPGASFLPAALTGPAHWLIGSPADLPTAKADA